jgi:hypothetical protein
VSGNVKASGIVYWGNGLVRTETRNNAGLQGDAGAKSGFFETSSPTNYPSGASSWWHLIDIRHSNNTNNYSMQIAGSFFDQNLYVRKINTNAAQPWSQIWTSANGGLITCGTANYVVKSDGTNGTCSQIYDNGTNVGVGTNSPLLKLDVRGNVLLGSAFTPTASNDDNILNLIVGSNSTGGTNGISFEENNGGFGMSLGYDGTGSGATNKMAIYSDSQTELVTFENGGEVGIGTTSPDDKLDVVGNAQVSGYLKVGNPSTPTTVNRPNTEIYRSTFNDYEYFDWVLDATCGSSSWSYTTYFDGDIPTQRCLSFENNGSYSRKYIMSPWIWIPTGSTSVYANGHNWCSLENGYDGVFLEYMTYSGSWTKITSFSAGGYPDNASGSNTSCNGTNSQSCWNGSMGNDSWHTNAIAGVAGNWIRFRFCGFEDGSNSTGDFTLDGFTVSVNMPSHGGAFATGNLYVQKNVYAGSNVMLGDLAEYFKVIDYCEAGDIISISDNQENSYEICKTSYSDNVLGVFSANPTLTLNDPNEGIPVALAGRCWVNATNKNGKIKIGDYLTSSDIPGHAMKADKSCFVIGRALTETDADGKVLVLVQQGWYNQYDFSTPSYLGSYIIGTGQNSVRIMDNHIGENSKIFLTMRGDPQHRWWVDKIEPGVFEIKFSDNLLHDISFDYLVEKPVIYENNNSNIENNVSKFNNCQKDIIGNMDKEKPQTEAPGNNRYENTGYTKVDLPLMQDSGIQPPGPPPDVNGKWIWTAKKGFKESNEQK